MSDIINKYDNLELLEIYGDWNEDHSEFTINENGHVIIQLKNVSLVEYDNGDKEITLANGNKLPLKNENI